MSINKVILVGNVGRDPEIRTMNNGNEVALFSLATKDVWKDKTSGEKKEKTEWHRIVIYSTGLVGVVKSYVKKGTRLYIEGSLQTRKWTDQQGIEKYSTEVVLQGFSASLQILSSKDSSSSGAMDDGYYSSIGGDVDNMDQTAGSQFVEEVIDDDIPF